MLAMLVGCGLRRGELLSLNLNSLQLREEHWVIADLIGKGGHIRTVPVPVWVKTAVDAWTAASEIREGRVFRAINKAGKIWGDGMTAKVLWEIVKDAASQAGIEKLAPHDLLHLRPALPSSGRRTGSDPILARSCFDSDH
jgi:site-specific recombinase XerD